MIFETFLHFETSIDVSEIAKLCVIFEFFSDKLDGFKVISSEKWIRNIVEKTKDFLSKNYSIEKIEIKCGIKIDLFICNIFCSLFTNQFSSNDAYSDFFDIFLIFLCGKKMEEFFVCCIGAIVSLKKGELVNCQSMLEIDCVFKIKYSNFAEMKTRILGIMKEVHHVNFLKIFN